MSKIKDSDLKSVIAALEADLNEAFEASKGSLVKAEGDEPKEPSEPSDDSASPPASDSASPASDAPPGADASASAPPGDMAGASAPAPQADPAAPQQGDQPLTPEALQAEYAQLPPEELDMHIQAAIAAKEALAASAGAGAAGGAPAGGMPPGASPGGPPPAAAGASPSPSPDQQMMPPAMKKEMSSHKQANGGMVKSEVDFKAELAAIKNAQAAEIAALQKSYKEDVENLTKAITMVVERPERKAVTGISYLKKTESASSAPTKAFSPAEAKAKLNELIPSLSKSERGLILDFYSGKVKVDALASIFDKIK
jgi:hypothetical protein